MRFRRAVWGLHRLSVELHGGFSELQRCFRDVTMLFKVLHNVSDGLRGSCLTGSHVSRRSRFKRFQGVLVHFSVFQKAYREFRVTTGG